MGPRRDLVRHRVGWIDPERLRALNQGQKRIAIREHEARHAVGQCRLANALRAADQPGMRDSPAAIGVQQGRLGLAMPE